YITKDPIGRLVARFTRAQVGMRHYGTPKIPWWLTLRLKSYGRGHQSPVAPVKPVLVGQQLQYVHRKLVEWFGNGAGGFEQGLTLKHRARGLSKVPVRIKFRLRG